MSKSLSTVIWAAQSLVCVLCLAARYDAIEYHISTITIISLLNE